MVDIQILVAFYRLYSYNCTQQFIIKQESCCRYIMSFAKKLLGILNIRLLPLLVFKIFRNICPYHNIV